MNLDPVPLALPAPRRVNADALQEFGRTPVRGPGGIARISDVPVGDQAHRDRGRGNLAGLAGQRRAPHFQILQFADRIEAQRQRLELSWGGESSELFQTLLGERLGIRIYRLRDRTVEQHVSALLLFGRQRGLGGCFDEWHFRIDRRHGGLTSRAALRHVVKGFRRQADGCRRRRPDSRGCRKRRHRCHEHSKGQDHNSTHRSVSFLCLAIFRLSPHHPGSLF